MLCVAVITFVGEAEFRESDFVYFSSCPVFDLIHELSNDVHPVTTWSAPPNRFVDIGSFIGTGIESLSFVPDSDGKPIRGDDDRYVDVMSGVSLIGVFNDIGTRLIDGNFQLFDGITF